MSVRHYPPTFTGPEFRHLPFTNRELSAHLLKARCVFHFLTVIVVDLRRHRNLFSPDFSLISVPVADRASAIMTVDDQLIRNLFLHFRHVTDHPNHPVALNLQEGV